MQALEKGASITILGAGIQGTCVALALRRAGYRVALLDQADSALSRASLRNEGKIHLGLVYAHDRTMATSKLMLRSALQFSSLLDDWVSEEIDWRGLSSRPFTYLVPTDSMLQPDELYTAYEYLQAEYVRLRKGDPNLSYLTRRPERLWQQIQPHGDAFPLVEDCALAIISTAELALDLDGLGQLLRNELHSSAEIECRFQHQILEVESHSSGFAISGIDAEQKPWRITSDIVINCLWENRLAIDSQLGILPNRPWVYRLKYRLLGELPPELAILPSMTLVVGPYGDIVVSPGKETYFSWYPSCMRGWSADLCTPEQWQAACTGQTEKEEAEIISREALAGLEQYVPGICHSNIRHVDAGVIFSWGKTDINDSQSELHQRHAIGVHVHGNYISIDTGKFTSAPLFAQDVVHQLTGRNES